jgi:flavin reductase (DIM6/NTAB) family NADH-FMN oxidoreductase RutF/uncharacterized protein YciI
VEFEIRLQRVRRDPFTEEAIRAHVDRLADLDDAGRLIAAGPRADGTGGVILARFADRAEAQRFADTEPFATGGWETVEVHEWQPADRANGYLDSSLPTRRDAPARRFVDLPGDERRWPRSPLPGQIVLVTTVDAGGEVNVAPESWVSMAAFDPPTVGFGCSTTHRTHRNVEDSGEFVVNVVPSSLAPRAWAMLGDHGVERVDHAGLTLLDATTVRPPRLAECSAHLECVHERTVEFGHGEVFIFGRITAASIDERALDEDVAVGYGRLDPCFFLHDRLHAGLAPPARTS